MTRPILRPRFGYVQKEGQSLTFVRDDASGIRSLPILAYRELIEFANIKTSSRRFEEKLFYTFSGSYGKTKEFYRDLSDAHKMAVDALSDLSRRGTLRDRVEKLVNKKMGKMLEYRAYSIKKGSVGTWVYYDIPTVGALTAFLIGMLSHVLSDEEHEVEGMRIVFGQCALNECELFFIEALKRGPRRKHCSTLHQNRDNQRRSRGTKK